MQENILKRSIRISAHVHVLHLQRDVDSQGRLVSTTVSDSRPSLQSHMPNNSVIDRSLCISHASSMAESRPVPVQPYRHDDGLNIRRINPNQVKAGEYADVWIGIWTTTVNGREVRPPSTTLSPTSYRLIRR
jgi:hypothetical protein